MSGCRRLIGGSAVQTSGKAASLGLQAAHFALVARLLVPLTFSRYVAALALFAIALALAEFGLLQTTVLELARRPAEERAVVVAAGRASAALGTLAAALAATVVFTVLPRGVGTAALLLVPAFVVSRLQLPFAGLRQHRLHFGRMAVAEVAGSAAAAVSLGTLFLVGVPNGHRVAASALTLGVGELVTLLLLVTRLPAGTSSAPAPVGAAVLLRQALPLGLAQAASFIHVRVDQVLLAGFGFTVGLAAYGVAYRSLDASLALVTGIGVVALPLLSRAGAHERLDLARRVQALLGVAAVLLGTMTFVLAPQIVAVLGGARYSGAVWYARLLCPVLVISVLNLGAAQVMIVEGATTALLGIAVLGVGVNVGLNLLLIPQLGVWGSISSTWASELLGAVLVAGAAHRRLPGFAPSRQLAGVVAGFSASCFGTLAAWQAWGALGGLPASLVAVALLVWLVGADLALVAGRPGRAPAPRSQEGRTEAAGTVTSADEDPATIDVVVLTWNDGPALSAAVRSVLGSQGVRPRVVVVDNGSDPPAEVPIDDRVLVVRNPANRGVAPGRNQGVDATTADYVCFLDSDARLAPDALKQMADALAGDTRVALAAPVFSGQPPEASAGRAPTLTRKTARVLGWRDTYRPAPTASAAPWWDVDFAIGACQLFRRCSFDAVGGLDESYFYGPEDVDFCLRLREAGWRVVQVAAADCHHPPRRRHRGLFTRQGQRHARAVARHLWRHRRFHRVAA